VLCTSGSFSGSFEAPFQFSILTLLPSPTVGVEYFDGKLTAHTPSGDLNCDLNGALNANTSSEGEFGDICLIIGGTGIYQHATATSGFGESSLTPLLMIPTGGCQYEGTIKTS
jgi:hypothetical protein